MNSMQMTVDAGGKNIADIMSNYEAEVLIEVLQLFPIEEYGSKEYASNPGGTARTKRCSGSTCRRTSTP